jgi:hypothetical protein
MQNKGILLQGVDFFFPSILLILLQTTVNKTRKGQGGAVWCNGPRGLISKPGPPLIYLIHFFTLQVFAVLSKARYSARLRGCSSRQTNMTYNCSRNLLLCRRLIINFFKSYYTKWYTMLRRI